MRLVNRLLVLWVALKTFSAFARNVVRPARWIDGLCRLSLRTWRRFTGKWRSLSPFQQHVLTNMLIGLTIAIALHAVHEIPMLHDLEDAGIDWAMRLYRGTSSSEMNVPLALFDIDEESYRAWGEPLATPRDKLLKLIRLAVDGQAAVVVVDIDVSRPGFDPSQDDALRDYFAEFSDCGGGEPSCAEKPLIVLMRTFLGPLPPERDLYRLQRPSFLDAVVERSPNIVWANPAFVREWDGLVRRWLLWEPSCAGQSPQVLPSVQLVVTAYLNGKDPDIRRLLAPLDSLRPENCEKPAGSILNYGNPDENFVTLGQLRIDLRDLTLQRRILYRIPWRLKEGETRAKILFKRQKVNVFSDLSAHRLIETTQPIDPTAFAGRIVLIGGSNQDSRDLYQTPLGEMPGVLILGNAIYSLMEHGQIHPPSLWQKLVIEAVLILLMSYLFARFSSFWGMLLSGVSIVVALIPLSLWLFGQGLWIDFAIPLVAVQLHEMVVGLKASVKQRNALHED